MSATPRLILKPVDIERDLEQIMQWRNDPEIVGNFAGMSELISREDEKKYLERMLASDNDRLFTIKNNEKIYLGQAGLHEINWVSRKARISVILGEKKHQNQGYGRNAVYALLEQAFLTYNLHKVWGMFLEENEKNRHFWIDICQFTVEGTLREEYFLNGRYRNMVRISILGSEYAKNSSELKQTSKAVL